MEKKLFQLRDCFTAGHTLPQYCIDNNIKRPLFISEKKFESFLWDVHVQFHYDKRLLPRFCFIDADEPDNMNSVFSSPLIVKNLSKMNLNDFDKVILLTQENIGVDVNKTISLHKLYTSFISKVYGDIPLLNFLQRYPKVNFLGPCHYVGAFAPFDKTIESYLQKMLNENDLPYCVENMGQHYFHRYQDLFYNLKKLNPKPDDIVFVHLADLISLNLPFLDLRNAFDPPHDFREIFVNKAHINEIGYKILAERFFKFLTENNFFRDKEFNYPLPPPRITDMAYRLGSSRAA